MDVALSPFIFSLPIVVTAKTFQLTVFPAAVLHPVTVDVLLDSTLLVPVTAAKLGIVVLQADHVVPLLVV